MAALIVLGGTLRAAVDTRRLLVGTLAVYSVGTLLAGLSWSMPVLFLSWSVVEGILVQPLGLSPAVWCIALGVALLVGFVHWEFRQERAGRPSLIPVSVLRNPTFAAGVCTFASESLFLAGFMLTVPVFLQSALGYSAFDSGLALLPFSVATLVVAVTSTGWRAYLAQKRLIQSGLVLIGVGMLLLVERTDLGVTIPELVVPMTVVGIGLGLFTGQVVDLTMSAVPESFSDVSSGVINSLSQLGYAFGTAVAGSVLLSQFYGSFVTEVRLLAGGGRVTGTERRRLAVRLADAREATTQAQQEAFVSGLSPDLRQQLVEIVQTAMVSAQRSVLVVLVVFVLVTLLVSSFLPLSRQGRGQAEEATGTLSEQPDAAKSE